MTPSEPAVLFVQTLGSSIIKLSIATFLPPRVRLAWMVDPRCRRYCTIAVYTTSEHAIVFEDGGIIDGGSVLPGWKFDTGLLFAELDRKGPPSEP